MSKRSKYHLLSDFGDGTLVKICICCKELKKADEFRADNRRPDGKQGYCSKCQANNQRLRRTPETIKNDNLKHNYGITLAEYQNLVSKQNRKCLICEEEIDNLVVDHCHTKGHVRGLLCLNCNFGIGSFKDNPDSLEMAKRYLQDFQHD